MAYEDNRASCNGQELDLDGVVEQEVEVVVGLREQQEAILRYSNIIQFQRKDTYVFPIILANHNKTSLFF